MHCGDVDLAHTHTHTHTHTYTMCCNVTIIDDLSNIEKIIQRFPLNIQNLRMVSQNFVNVQSIGKTKPFENLYVCVCVCSCIMSNMPASYTHVRVLTCTYHSVTSEPQYSQLCCQRWHRKTLTNEAYCSLLNHKPHTIIHHLYVTF